jgi:predicted  nucleic acid-binding Zn-ribbon protein
MRVDYDKDQLAYALANALKERDEANQELSKKYVEYGQLFDEAEKIRIERDEAREKYATEATEHMLAVNKLCGERDEALEKLNPLRQSLRDSQDEVLRLTLENRIF